MTPVRRPFRAALALAAALITYGMERHLVAKVAAVSVGLVNGLPYLDLDYSEDSRADVDFNVVGTDAGAYVELQGTPVRAVAVNAGVRLDRSDAFGTFVTYRGGAVSQPPAGPSPRATPGTDATL